MNRKKTLFLSLLYLLIAAITTTICCMEKKIDTQKKYLKKLAHDAALKLKGYDDNAKIYWHPTLIYAERDKNINITNIIQSFSDFDIVLEKDIDAKDSQKKDESHWQPLKKKDLRKEEIYLICTGPDYKNASNFRLRHVLDEYLYKKKTMDWYSVRVIIAAAILAGVHPAYINDLIHFHDGEFIYFLTKKEKIQGHYFYRYCKTVPMVQLLEHFTKDSDTKNMLLKDRSLESECSWKVLDYLIKEKNLFKNNEPKLLIARWTVNLCELFSHWIRDVEEKEYYLYRKSQLYNHFKKLHLLISFNKEHMQVFSENHKSHLSDFNFYLNRLKFSGESIWSNDEIFCKQILKYYPWYLPEVLEILGNDYGDFPARKLFGQNAFNSTSFDIKLFYT